MTQIGSTVKPEKIDPFRTQSHCAMAALLKAARFRLKSYQDDQA
jgi:hypothetical protein